MKNVVSMVADRFKEPSSWGAVATALMGLGVNAPTPVWQAVGYIGAGVCTLLAFFLTEKK